MPPKDKYTDPKLRDEIKKELQESDKGGAPGQWSARKAQMMAQEYKRRGGSYNTDKSQKDESQENLSKWGEEDWQTRDGSGHAKQEDGTEKRYLPKKAWENMDDAEKDATEEKKEKGSKKGQQYVENTDRAKQERKKASDAEGENTNRRTTRSQGKDQHNAKNSKQAKSKQGDDESSGEASKKSKTREKNGTSSADDKTSEKESPKAGEKRKTGTKQATGSNDAKKQKTRSSSAAKQGNAPPGKIGSKHMDAAEPGPRGSADRLPKKGQQVTWKAMPGYVDGKLVEILTSDKKIEGKSVKASKADPRLVLESSASGKICVHKPETCFYKDE